MREKKNEKLWSKQITTNRNFCYGTNRMNQRTMSKKKDDVEKTILWWSNKKENNRKYTKERRREVNTECIFVCIYTQCMGIRYEPFDAVFTIDVSDCSKCWCRWMLLFVCMRKWMRPPIHGEFIRRTYPYTTHILNGKKTLNFVKVFLFHLLCSLIWWKYNVNGILNLSIKYLLHS